MTGNRVFAPKLRELVVHSGEWSTGCLGKRRKPDFFPAKARASGPLGGVDHWLYQNLSFYEAGALPSFPKNTKEALPLEWQGCLLLTGLFAVLGVGDPDAGYD